MARKRRCKVFVSYSRHDEALVRPLASLLGTVAEDAVFFWLPLEYALCALIDYSLWYSVSGYFRSRMDERADAIANRVRAYFASLRA